MKTREVEIHEPHSLDMREVFTRSIEELGKPFPSLPLCDWELFNRMTGGFRVREFSILCGSTGTGKTTFLANLSAQFLKKNIRHFVMSVETGYTDFMKRILSVLEGRDLNTGDPVPAGEIEQIHLRAIPYLRENPIQFALYEDRLPVEQLIHDIEFMVHTRGCKIAMIDNLNFFMEVTRASDAVVEMDRVIHELIIFCKKVDVHIVMVMHPKKTDGDTRVRNEFDVKGSSTAVQEAHNVFLFNRPRAEDTESGAREEFDRELTLAKMRRRGAFVGKTLVFESRGTRYTEKGFA